MDTISAQTAGSLSDPTAIKPQLHYGAESKLPWTEELRGDLPQVETREDWPGDHPFSLGSWL